VVVEVAAEVVGVVVGAVPQLASTARVRVICHASALNQENPAAAALVVVEVVVVGEEVAVQAASTATKRDTCHVSAPSHHVEVVAAETVGDVVEIEDVEAVAETGINPVMY
jgi:hypothetical protein